MGKSRAGVSPGIKSALAEAGAVHRGEAQVTGRDGPVVSAIQFANLTRETGGATMNAHTGQFTQIGSTGYGVGGLRSSSSHRRIATYSAPAPNRNLGLDTVLQQTGRIRRMTRGQESTANIGSWVIGGGPQGRADIDASEVEQHLPTAVAKGVRRSEDAIFDFGTGKDITLPTTRNRKR